MVKYKLLPGGALDYADFDGTKITFRHDGYRGFQFLIYSHEREFAVRLCDDLTGEYCGLSFSLDYSVTDDALAVCCRVKNTTDSDFSADRLGVRLGTDCYMENIRTGTTAFSPTLLRCEKRISGDTSCRRTARCWEFAAPTPSPLGALTITAQCTARKITSVTGYIRRWSIF